MQILPPVKRFIYAFGFIASVVVVAGVSVALLTNAITIENTEASPKLNTDIHSKVIHRSIINQLLQIEGDGTGYLATTLHRVLPSIDGSTSDPLDVLGDDIPYTGDITSTSGARYQVEAELLTAGDEVIPVYIELTLIEEDEL